MKLPDDLDEFLKNLLAKKGSKFSAEDLEYIKTILEAVWSGEPSVLLVKKKGALKYIVTGAKPSLAIQMLAEVIESLASGLPDK